MPSPAPHAAVAEEAAAPAAIGAGDRQEYRQQIGVGRPRLWSLEERNLYRLRTEVQVDGRTVDRYETAFGIRSVRFDAARGFRLNGAPVKLRGTCNHQDHAGVGAALPDAVQRFRVRKLQEMGSNALRTSHNPPTPELPAPSRSRPSSRSAPAASRWATSPATTTWTRRPRRSTSRTPTSRSWGPRR